MTTGARASQPRAFVVRRHHLLVRISHWLNIPLLLGVILSGISIYWASPIYQHSPKPTTGSFDYLADAGIWICAHTAPSNARKPAMDLRFHWTKENLHAEIVRAEALDFFKEIEGGGKPRTH